MSCVGQQQHGVLLYHKNTGREINNNSDIHLMANMEAMTRLCSQKLKLISSALLVFVILLICHSNVIVEPTVHITLENVNNDRHRQNKIPKKVLNISVSNSSSTTQAPHVQRSHIQNSWNHLKIMSYRNRHRQNKIPKNVLNNSVSVFSSTEKSYSSEQLEPLKDYKPQRHRQNKIPKKVLR